MPPLLLANWREINRRFCLLCWLVALALAVAIIGQLPGLSTACASRQTARAGTACAPHAAELSSRR
jgi:hypothetical protein